MPTLNQRRAAAALALDLIENPRIVTYGEMRDIIARRTGVKYATHAMGCPLDVLAEAAHSRDLPYITLMVVKAGSTLPAPDAYDDAGFLLDLKADDVPAEQQRALTFDWTLNNPKVRALTQPETYGDLRGLSITLKERSEYPADLERLYEIAADGNVLPAEVLAEHPAYASRLAKLAYAMAHKIVTSAQLAHRAGHIDEKAVIAALMKGAADAISEQVA